MVFKIGQKKGKTFTVFVVSFILFSFLKVPQSIGYTGQFERCGGVFEPSEYVKSIGAPLVKPDVRKFMKGKGFQQFMQNILTSFRFDRPKILVVKFKNNFLNRKTVSGVFSLFLMIWPNVGQSQQSLFNVPSIEPTELGTDGV